MFSSKTVAFRIMVLCLLFGCSQAKPSSVKRSKVNDSKLIVISLDGLMFSQIQENVMPFMTNFYKNGVHCPRLQPVFPTKTLVNHFSIATGTFDFLKNFPHQNVIRETNWIWLEECDMKSEMSFFFYRSYQSMTKRSNFSSRQFLRTLFRFWS